MGNVIEMRERMNALLVELSPLHAAEERSAEQEARIDQILAEVNDLGPKIEREAMIAATAARRADYSEPVRRIGGGQPAPAEERGEVIDRRSIGRRFVESDEFKAGRQGRGLVPPVKYDGLLARATRDEMEQRALVYSGTAPASMLLPQVLPTVYRGLEAPLACGTCSSTSAPPRTALP